MLSSVIHSIHPYVIIHPFVSDTPKVIEHPQPQVLEIGHKLFLTCQAQGSSPLEFQWFRNGEALIYGTAQELVINKVQMADQGVYVCCIKNASGSSVLTKGAQVVGKFILYRKLYFVILSLSLSLSL